MGTEAVSRNLALKVGDPEMSPTGRSDTNTIPPPVQFGLH